MEKKMKKKEKIDPGMTALMDAVESENEAKVRRCLLSMKEADARHSGQHHNGADHDADDHDDDRPQQQRQQQQQDCSSLSLSVNATDAWGRTALMYAAHHGNNATIARLLLDHGADIHMHDQFGETALIKACKAERIAMITVLVQHSGGGGAAGGAAFRQNRYGRSPLSMARRLDTIYALLRADPSVWTTTTMMRRRHRLDPPPPTTDIGPPDNEGRRSPHATDCSDDAANLRHLGPTGGTDDQRLRRQGPREDRPVALVKRQGNNVFLHRCRGCGATHSVPIVRSGRAGEASSSSSVEKH